MINEHGNVMKNEAEMTLVRTTGEKLLFNLIYCYSLRAKTENNNPVRYVRTQQYLPTKLKSSHVLPLKPEDIETAVSTCVCVCVFDCLCARKRH